MSAYLGIDPGLDGFLCLLIEPEPDASPQPIFQFWPMPAAEAKRGRRIQRLALAQVFGYLPEIRLGLIETQTPGPKQSSRSAAKSGEGYGLLLMGLAMRAIPHEEVSPREWKKALGVPAVGGEQTENKKKRKAVTIDFAQALFPWVDLRANERCNVPHDGKAEALLLAEYARRRWSGESV